MTYLNVGDKITIEGEAFILVEFKKELDKPSTVRFVQPMELLEK